MDCQMFYNVSPVGNISEFIDVELSPSQKMYQSIEDFLYTKIILCICIFGLLGNLLNLMILTRKSLANHMDRMEKSAHMGLLALAISDFLFCLCALPKPFHKVDQFEHRSVSFWLLYDLYGAACINIFIMASTWLTVAMAVSRYLAICYPIRGREVLGVTFSRISIFVVFAFCVIFNLPRFWMLQVKSIDCADGGKYYFQFPGPLKQSALAESVYMWLYFIFCIFVPLVVLTFCNMYLIRALRISAKMRRQHTRGRDHSLDSKNIVTLTLTIIVIFYIFLVAPAEILNFGKDHVVTSMSVLIPDQYNLAVAFCNTLQAINFACNFVLYCVINVHFRRAVKQVFWCRFQENKMPRWSLKYDSVTGTTTAYSDASYPAACTRI